MDLEEACDAARSITTANNNAILLVLFPLQHTSCDKAMTVKNRRTVEDRLFQLPACKLLILVAVRPGSDSAT